MNKEIIEQIENLSQDERLTFEARTILKLALAIEQTREDIVQLMRLNLELKEKIEGNLK